MLNPPLLGADDRLKVEQAQGGGGEGVGLDPAVYGVMTGRTAERPPQIRVLDPDPGTRQVSQDRGFGIVIADPGQAHHAHLTPSGFSEGFHITIIS